MTLEILESPAGNGLVRAQDMPSGAVGIIESPDHDSYARSFHGELVMRHGKEIQLILMGLRWNDIWSMGGTVWVRVLKPGTRFTVEVTP